MRELGHEGVDVRRPAIVLLQGLQVLARPRRAVVDLDLCDGLGKSVAHGHGQPLPAVGGADAISILPLVLLELHVLEQNEHIGSVHLVEVAEPWQVLRLMSGECL